MRKFTMRIGLLVGVALAAFLAFGPGIVERGKNAVIAHDPYPVSDAARALHARLTVGDWHADSLLWNRDLTRRASYGHVDFPRLRDGNVAMQVFTTVTFAPAGINVDYNAAGARDNVTLLAMAQLWPPRTWNSLLERALYQAQKLHQFQAAAPDAIQILRTRGDLQMVLDARATGSKQVAALIGAEGAHALEGDLANLDRMYDAGFRLIGLHHFLDNELGGSLHGETHAGLTDFGREVVRAMTDRHMIIDLTHSS
ncbi:MAG: membrane dipeptidase, partial [Paracoccaceae bacterium]|nr:membrane dipeptidase [Paracoccaceae bacterium]